MKHKIKKFKDHLLKFIHKIFSFKLTKKEKKEIKESGLRLVEVAVIVAIATCTGIIGGSFFTYSYLKDKPLNSDKEVLINKDLKEVSSIYENIANNYYQDIDRPKVVQGAIQGMLAALGDDYAAYFDQSAKEQFDERMEGSYYGVGVELTNDTKGNIVITDVFDETPAFKAGIKIGDIVKEINGSSTANMDSSNLAAIIKTSSAKDFTFTFDRSGTPVTIKVSKQKVILKSVTTNIFNKNNKKIGYIDVSIFANNTYDQFGSAVLDLEKEHIDSLIIDVRNNSGGYLSAVQRMISLFFKKGTVIYQLQTKDKITKIEDNTEDARSYPVSVLINGNSASASEILSAAFKEAYKSEIIGEVSYGKGKVQQTEDLGDGAMIKFTTQKWLTPDGNWINGKGVEPTIKVTLDANYSLNPTPDNDNQLQTAINTLAK